MEHNTRPTKKQKKVFQKVINEDKSVSQAMKEVGYAPSSATNPSTITRSKGWEQLMETYLPDEKLAQVHLEGLNATKLSGTGGMRLSVDADGDVEQFGHSDLETPDYAVRHKYLDSAYKLKGSYAPERSENKSLNVEVTVDQSNLEEVAKKAAELLKQQKTNGASGSN